MGIGVQNSTDTRRRATNSDSVTQLSVCSRKSGIEQTSHTTYSNAQRTHKNMARKESNGGGAGGQGNNNGTDGDASAAAAADSEFGLDQVLVELGSTGRFQIMIFALLLVPVVLFSMYEMTYLFTTGRLDYRYVLNIGGISKTTESNLFILNLPAFVQLQNSRM